jgi:beta-galactosidase
MSAATAANPLVICDWSVPGPPPEAKIELQRFIMQGGNVLMLHPGDSLAKLFPEQIKAFTRKDGEIVTMHVPESPVFAGIQPLDLAWFELGGRRVPIACAGIYQIAEGRKDTTALASQFDIHGYLQTASDVEKMSGCPLVEIRLGKGRLLASELCLELGDNDPIARRVLMNLIEYLQPKPQ